MRSTRESFIASLSALFWPGSKKVSEMSPLRQKKS